MFTFPIGMFGGIAAGLVYVGPAMAFGNSGKTWFANDGYTFTENPGIPGDYVGSFYNGDFYGPSYVSHYLACDGAGTMYLCKERGDGEYGSFGDGNYNLMKSTDGGVTWSDLITTGSFRPSFLKYVNGRLYTCLSGEPSTLQYTTNEGSSWTTCTDSTTNGFYHVMDMVYTGSYYIACGVGGTGDGEIWRSSDGNTFVDPTTLTVATEGSFTCLAYKSGVVVAGGNASGGTLRSSADDGDTWTNRSLGSSSIEEVQGAAANGSEFIIMTGGGSGAEDDGEIHRSTDGATWTRTYTNGSESFYSAAYSSADSLWVITGKNQTTGVMKIMTSADATASSFTNRTPGATAGQIVSTCIQYDASTDEFAIAAESAAGGVPD